MDETIRQIEGEIHRTRADLGSHLRELEARVDSAMDWREQVRARPYAAVGMALAAGLVCGQLIGHRGRPGLVARAATTVPRSMVPRSIAGGQAYALFENVASAMIAVAAARLTAYIGGLVPGFSEEFRRVEATGRRPAPPTTAPVSAVT